MLQAHSLLWHYLWLAPNFLFVLLAVLLRRKNLSRPFPVFFIYLIVVALEQFTLYILDLTPTISAETYWKAFWAGLLVEAVVKFALIGEVFSHLFSGYQSVAGFGRTLVRGVGICLAFIAAIIAAHSRWDSGVRLLAGAHIVEQTTYLVECGVLVFILVLAAYFRLSWGRPELGIALGLGLSATLHLATWAVLTNGGLSVYERNLLDFTNMSVSHLCVLIWFYYLLVPQKKPTTSAVSLPENNLAIWNRELERLIR